MIVYTDSPAFARHLVSAEAEFVRLDAAPTSPGELPLVRELFCDSDVWRAECEFGPDWAHLFAVEKASLSQYDLLIELSRSGEPLPDRTLCVAGEGTRFHGFRGRSWSSPPGNVYLCAYFEPNRPAAEAGPALMAAAALASIDAIDSVPELSGKAQIKWVNDVLIEDAKVSGVLAYSQVEGDLATAAVVGIGLNVETAPTVEPTPFVPIAASLAGIAPDSRVCTQSAMFQRLASSLRANCQTICDGDRASLLDRYRLRSLAIGREVSVRADTPEQEEIATGRVVGIGDDLSLLLAGCDKPVTRGRLILK